MAVLAIFLQIVFTLTVARSCQFTVSASEQLVVTQKGSEQDARLQG